MIFYVSTDYLKLSRGSSSRFGFVAGGDLFTRFGVTSTAERVEDGEGNSCKQQDGRHRSHQDADGQDGGWFLDGGIGYVTAPLKYKQG